MRRRVLQEGMARLHCRCRLFRGTRRLIKLDRRRAGGSTRERGAVEVEEEVGGVVEEEEEEEELLLDRMEPSLRD